MLPTNGAATLVLRVDERELRVLAGGEMVGSSFAGPGMIWVIFALGRNVGVAGVMAGEGRFEDGETEGDRCCGGEKRACIVVVEPTLAVRVRGNGEG